MKESFPGCPAGSLRSPILLSPNRASLGQLLALNPPLGPAGSPEADTEPAPGGSAGSSHPAGPFPRLSSRAPGGPRPACRGSRSPGRV